MSDSKCDPPPTYSATGDGSWEESERQLADQELDVVVPSTPPCGRADGPSSSQHLLYNYPPQDISTYYPPPCLPTVMVEPCPPPYSLEQPLATGQVQPMSIAESTRNTPKDGGTNSYFSFSGAICLSCFNICCCVPGLLCGLAAFFTAVQGLHSASRGNDLNARRKILNSYKIAVAGIIFGTVMIVIVSLCKFFL